MEEHWCTCRKSLKSVFNEPSSAFSLDTSNRFAAATSCNVANFSSIFVRSDFLLNNVFRRSSSFFRRSSSSLEGPKKKRNETKKSHSVLVKIRKKNSRLMNNSLTLHSPPVNVPVLPLYPKDFRRRRWWSFPVASAFPTGLAALSPPRPAFLLWMQFLHVTFGVLVRREIYSALALGVERKCHSGSIRNRKKKILPFRKPT